MNRAMAMLGAAALLVAPALAQTDPPPHTAPFPQLGAGPNTAATLVEGPELERGRSAREMLADRRRLDAALAALQPQRRGTVDAYVVSVALDSDQVFAREAREAGRVLARRYDAAGRTITLAGPDGARDDLPRGSITSLTLALARVAEVLDPKEDVLVLFVTTHGAPEGLAYHYGDSGYGVLSPPRLAALFSELGIERRILVLNACFSGVFVPYLWTGNSAILTAAAPDRTSFGCAAENDWTFFGDALVNNALRKPNPLNVAAAEAGQTVAGWERQQGIAPSLPQVYFGTEVAAWLPALEARMPRSATEPVGVPAFDSPAVRALRVP